jgi:hypothetical protein
MLSKILVYLLAGIVVSTAVVYFYVASGEYSDMIDFIVAGVMGEIQEKQIEMTLFLSTGVGYMLTVIWMLKKKLSSVLPYIVLMVGSIVMIGIYIASRTVGVPPIGIEYYIGKMDITTKILQVLISALSVYLICYIQRGWERKLVDIKAKK